MGNKQIVTDKNLIAYCGLYCGACRTYLKGKCPGCLENVKATWCKTRRCAIENKYLSCADCTKVDFMACTKFNNFISRLFGVIFNSDRPACIKRIKEIGYDNYASEMATNKRQTIKRTKG
ncbi:MAG: DUF3795 domain-containing protein [Bacteroidetes bacterium]|nr:DUF3795 domain-containing protein [Bacteroidota bacterium]